MTIDYCLSFIENFSFRNRDEVRTILSQILSLSTARRQIDRIEEFAEKKDIDLEKELEDAWLNLQWADENVPIIKDSISTHSTIM